MTEDTNPPPAEDSQAESAPAEPESQAKPVTAEGVVIDLGRRRAAKAPRPTTLEDKPAEKLKRARPLTPAMEKVITALRDGRLNWNALKQATGIDGGVLVTTVNALHKRGLIEGEGANSEYTLKGEES